MKKTNLLLTLLATFALAACGGSSNDNSDNLDAPNDNGKQKVPNDGIASTDLYNNSRVEAMKITIEEITMNDKKVAKDGGIVPMNLGMNAGTYKAKGSDQLKKIVIYRTSLNDYLSYEASDGYMAGFSYGRVAGRQLSKDELNKFAGDSGKISYEGIATSSMDMHNPGKFTYELDVAKLTGHGKIEGISKFKHKNNVYNDVEITLPEAEFSEEQFDSNEFDLQLSSKEFNGTIEVNSYLHIDGNGKEIAGYIGEDGLLKHTLMMVGEAK